MIIELESATAENAEAAKHRLEAMAHSWGYDIAEAPAEVTATAATTHRDDKVVDPVAVATLVTSIPSAALAVLDLADRIQKRRRAKELIDHAQQLADQHVTVSVRSQSRTVELRTLDPDQLLDLMAHEDPAS
jgi:hypothetical protein